MPIAIILWSLLILVIAINTSPGYFGMLLILLLAAGAIIVTIALIKTRRNVRDFNREAKKLPKQPWDDLL